MNNEDVLHQDEGFYKITALKIYRKTAGVMFDALPVKALGCVEAIDRVVHDQGALSPGTVSGVERPWYLHEAQEDNLVVLAGFRDIDLYKDGEFLQFRLTPRRLEVKGMRFFDQPVMLSWSTGVFHRIQSSPEKGSASLNIPVRRPGFDIRTNFHIYDLDLLTGESRVIREGHLDQSGE
ncbi:MAG: hypothetical protein JW843_01445 [Candidatus Aminicenantes bacterium]|nr:hypothetical protein [Candidatus Aminicenantes bacterium]